jgi:hypothetical protein
VAGLAHLPPAFAGFFLGLLFGPEDGGNTYLRKHRVLSEQRNTAYLFMLEA